MRIKLIVPNQYEGKRLIRYRRFFLPTLTMPTLAGLTPDDVRVHIHDDYLDPVDYEDRPDLVALTGMLLQRRRAHEIADAYRARGVPVVLGGIQASTDPDDAARHADAVVVGEAETLWSQVIRDAEAGRLQARYRAQERPNLQRLVLPRYDLLDLKRYCKPPHWRTPYIPIQTARGCPHDCAFCSVTVFLGRKIRCKPIEHVLAEMRSTGARRFFFSDDNINAVPARSKRLFDALAGEGVSWIGQFSIKAADDRDLLERAAASGCDCAFVGLESIDAAGVASLNKTHHHVEDYERALGAFRAAGLNVNVSLIFGLDSDGPTVFDRTVDFLIRCRVSYAFFFPLQPFPGTRCWDDLDREGRLLPAYREDPSVMNDEAVVYQPKTMSRADLRRGVWHAYRRFFGLGSILRRNLRGPRALYAIGANLFMGSQVARGLHPLSGGEGPWEA